MGRQPGEDVAYRLEHDDAWDLDSASPPVPFPVEETWKCV